ncbi:hypothetical protein B0T25DRAFT_597094 [Lasiosphaeria hispida]|uniref:Uncharacterized protein n=1 Tax=Lasiosphaeria hispida TaxID=260671 RepID=A0AAJ0HW61_9PEZI|nr:hypothetical protein B0T25DRAFT_597094 [Lasiosphaeria hispida]
MFNLLAYMADNSSNAAAKTTTEFRLMAQQKLRTDAKGLSLSADCTFTGVANAISSTSPDAKARVSALCLNAFATATPKTVRIEERLSSSGRDCPFGHSCLLQHKKNTPQNPRCYGGIKTPNGKPSQNWLPTPTLNEVYFQRIELGRIPLAGNKSNFFCSNLGTNAICGAAYDKAFHIATDASLTGTGAVMFQLGDAEVDAGYKKKVHFDKIEIAMFMSFLLSDTEKGQHKQDLALWHRQLPISTANINDWISVVIAAKPAKVFLGFAPFYVP